MDVVAKNFSGTIDERLTFISMFLIPLPSTI